MPPARTIKLEDLSPEQRAALVAEAKGAAAVEQEAADAAAKVRDRAWAAKMHERDHLRDCPTEKSSGDDLRIEAYAHTKPARPADGIPAQPVTVVRCITCGGSTIIQLPFADVLAEVETATEDALAAA